MHCIRTKTTKIVFVFCVNDNDWLRSDGRWDGTCGVRSIISKRNGHSATATNKDCKNYAKLMLASDNLLRLRKLNWSCTKSRKENFTTHVATMMVLVVMAVARMRARKSSAIGNRIEQTPWCSFRICHLISWIFSVPTKGARLFSVFSWIVISINAKSLQLIQTTSNREHLQK